MSFLSTLDIRPYSEAGCGIHFYGAINPHKWTTFIILAFKICCWNIKVKF